MLKFWNQKNDKPIETIKVVPVEPSVPENTELSCFVKGVIKSIEEDKNGWTWNGFQGIIHKSTALSIYPPNSEENITIPGVELTKAEQLAISLAMKNWREFQVKKIQIKIQKEAEKKKVFFETLGCP